MIFFLPLDFAIAFLELHTPFLPESFSILHHEQYVHILLTHMTNEASKSFEFLLRPRRWDESSRFHICKFFHTLLRKRP